MNKLFFLLLLLSQGCLGPGIFKEKTKPTPVVEPKGTFSSSINFVPFTETYNPLPNSITINFEEMVDMNTVSLDDIVITGTGSCPNPLVMSSSISEHSLVVLLNTIGCSDGDEVKTIVNMANIFDESGKAGLGSFSQNYKLDTQSAVSPIINLTSGAVNSLPTWFTFLLDSSIDLQSVSPRLFDITGTGSCLANPYLGYTLTGNMVTVQLDVASCQNTDEISIAINNTELWSIGGRPGIGRMLRVLTLDTAGPSSSEISLNLLNGWYNPLPVTADLDFPSDVNMDEVTIDDFMAVGNGTCSGNLVSGLTKNDHHITLSLNTATCSNGNTVNFDLDLRNIKDHAGNSGSGNVSASLTLLTSNPQSPVLDIDSGIFSTLPALLTADFGADIDMSSVASALMASGSGACQSHPLISSSNTLQQTSILLNTVGCQHGDHIKLQVDMSKIKNHMQVAGSGIIEKIFTLDSRGPASPILDYESGAYNPLPLALNLQFEADTDMSSVNTNSVTVSGSGACPAASITQMAKADKTLTLTLDSLACGNSDALTLSVDLSLIKDTQGNFGSGVITKTFTLSNSLPTAPSISVAPGIKSALPNQLDLTFDAQINMNSVSLADLTLQGTGSCSGVSIASAIVSGQSISLVMNNHNCGDGSSMILSVDMSGIETNVPTAGSGTVRFTYQLDKQGPASAIMSPASGVLATLPQNIFITLPDDTNMSSVTDADFELQALSGCSTLALNNLTITGTIVKLNIDASSCSNAGMFTVKTNLAGINDLVGNAGSGSHQTQYSLDNTGPALASFSPLSNTFQSLPQIMTLIFPDDTDMTSVSAADFIVVGTNNCQSNAFSSITKVGQIATVAINTLGCLSGDSISVTLDMSGVTDLLGNAGSGSGQQVYTLDNSGVTSGSISVSPVAGTYSSLPTSVVFTLPADVKMSTVDQSDFTASGTGHCSANALSSISKTGFLVTLNLMTSGCWSDDSITISMNLAGTTDLLNNPGVGYVQKIYKLDNVGPSLLSLTPASQTLRAIPTDVDLLFPNDTDMSTFSMADITISGAGACITQTPPSLIISGVAATLNLDLINCSHNAPISVTVNHTGIKDNIGNSGVSSSTVTYTIDNQGPLAGVPSLASATLKTLPASMTFTFPSDTDMTSVTSADFSVIGSGNCPASALNSLSISGFIATLNFNSSGCLNTDSLSVLLDMSNVSDALGNIGTGSVSRTFTLDNAGPALISMNPASGTYQNIPTVVSLVFDADTDMSTVTTTDFSAVGSAGCALNGISALNISSVTATLTLNTSGCVHNSTMNVTVNMTGVSDLAGNAGSGSVTRSFAKDSQGPTSATVNALASTFNVLPSSLTYTFAADTDMSSVTAADFSAVGSGSCATNANSGISISGFVVTLNLNTSGCSNSDAVAITLNMSGVTDSLGNSGSGSVVRTLTMDNQGPTAPSMNVASGSVKVIPTSLSYTFGSDTDMSSITPADFSIVGSGSCPSPIGSISISGYTATLSYGTSGCAHGNNLSINLNMSGVSDLTGNAGSGSLSRVFTLDTQAPTILSATPASYDYQVMPAAVAYTFDADTDMSTVTTADFTAVGSAGCQVNALGTLSKSGVTATLSLVTTGCVNNSQLTVTANLSGISDLVGNAGAGSLVRVFKKDTVAPVVPGPNILSISLIGLPTALSYTFPSDVDMSTVTAANFSAVGSLGCPVPQLNSVSFNGNVATLNLDTNNCGIVGTVKVKIMMTGIKDKAGNTGTSEVESVYIKVL